jgi:hypothetical protein
MHAALCQQYCSDDRQLVINKEIPSKGEGADTLAIPKWEFQLSGEKKLWKTHSLPCKSRLGKTRCCAKLLLKS